MNGCHASNKTHADEHVSRLPSHAGTLWLLAGNGSRYPNIRREVLGLSRYLEEMISSYMPNHMEEGEREVRSELHL